MPHIIVEYTETLNLDFPKMLAELHSSLAGFETIDINAIKTRAIPVKYNIVGDGNGRQVFIHVTIKLMEGRDTVLRMNIAKALHAIAKHHTHDDRIPVSCEVHEMNVNTYVK